MVCEAITARRQGHPEVVTVCITHCQLSPWISHLIYRLNLIRFSAMIVTSHRYNLYFHARFGSFSKQLWELG